MYKGEKAALIVAKLKGIYPLAVCSLNSEGDAWRLLVMGRLSAQCTDERVNIVSVPLFKTYPTATDMAAAQQPQVERLIFSCGLYRTKARDLIGMSQRITEVYSGRVPDTMEELLTLPGVGRKIANLILGDVYHKPAIVADTHCIRISARIGLVGDGKPLSPEKTERELSANVEPDEQSDLCHRLVLFGRDTCRARSPLCESCPIRELCAYPPTETSDSTKANL